MLNLRRYYILFVLIGLTIFTHKGFAATEERFVFMSLGVSQGLSQNSAQVILKDQVGFMWIGTKEGLNRYDGMNFKTYKSIYGDNKTVAYDDITALNKDTEGNIYVGTKNGRVSKYIYNEENFVQVATDIFNDGVVNSIYTDTSGQVWIATTKGLFISKDNGKTFFEYVNENLFPVGVAIDNWLLSRGSDKKEQKNNFVVKQIIEGRNYSLWFATNKGLLLYNVKNDSINFYKNTKRSSDFTSITMLFDGNVLLGTKEEGLFVFDPATEEFSPYVVNFGNDEKLGENITALMQDNYGNIWVGSDDEGLSVINFIDAKAEKYKEDTDSLGGLKNDRILCFEQTKSGNIWIGTASGGVYVYEKNKILIEHIYKDRNIKNTVSNNSIQGFAEGKEPNTYWIATENGVNLWNSATNTFKYYYHDENNIDTIASNRCTGLYVDKTGLLWAFSKHGVSYYDEKNDKFIRFIPNSAFFYNSVNRVFQDNQKNYWYGSDNGLLFFDAENESYRIYTYEKGNLPSNVIHNIFEDSSGDIWISTNKGVTVFSYETQLFTEIVKDKKNIFDGILINSFFEDNEHIWFGTNETVFCYLKADKTVKRISSSIASNFDSVFGILDDENGNLWMSTNRGIVVYNRYKNEVAMILTPREGIQSYEFNKGAYYKNSKGEMFFGGINGFNYFLPKHIKKNLILPPLLCTNIEINNVPVKNFSQYTEEGKAIELSYNKSRLTVQYILFDYYIPKFRGVYAYKLSGHDDDWTITQNNNVSFDKLPAGDYVLYIKGAGDDNVWNDKNPLEIKIHMQTPPWRRWWAIGIYIIIGLYIFRHFLRYQRKKVLAIEENNHRLSELIEEKTWELQFSVQLLNEKNRKLYYLTMHDELTGFFNRKRFADIELDFSNGLYVDRMPFCIIVGDIDGLKLINDSLGHVYGDELLKSVATILKSALREEDIACRIGGDEFVLIVPDCNKHTLERIFAHIKYGQDVYNNNPENDLYISVSLGYSFLDQDGVFKVAFEVADEMMYVNKNKHKEENIAKIQEKINQTIRKLNL